MSAIFTIIFMPVIWAFEMLADFKIEGIPILAIFVAGIIISMIFNALVNHAKGDDE